MSKTAKEQQNSRAPEERNYNIDEYRRYFSTLDRNLLRDIGRNTTDRTPISYYSYTLEEVLGYLRSPERFESTLRKLSRQLYNTSTHYRRMINYYAFMPLWYYTVSPLNYDPNKTKVSSFRKQYQRTMRYLENANIEDEMRKVFVNAYVDGIFYGVIWQSNNSFFIQQINPDYCHLSAIEDGRYCFSFDFSKISEKQLYLYPPEFSELYRIYATTGVKEHEIPSAISFVYKPDPSTQFPFPPFISLAPDVFELENVRELLGSATELDNYKLLHMNVEVKDGVPSMPMDLNRMFLEHIQQQVPRGIGVVMSPGKLQDISFEQSKATNHSEEMSTAISNFWYNSGTLGALFGNPDIIAASAMRLAIKVDEQYIFGCVAQIERILNALLKQLSGSIKFRIHFIKCTVFSRDDVAEELKTAATLGVPGSKLAYASVLGMQQSVVEGLAFLENDVMQITDHWMPLKSSYTQTADDQGGRSRVKDGSESESTDRGRDNDSDANKEEE